MVRGQTRSTSPTIGIRRHFSVTPIYRQEPDSVREEIDGDHDERNHALIMP
jgi:hypothetical protein